MILESYLAIKQRLSSNQHIAHIDWFYSQYAEYGDGNLVYATPCVYVEFSPVNWMTVGGLVQKANMAVTIHVVSSSGYGAEDNRQIESTDGLTIQHLTLVKEIYKLLQGFSCKYDYLPNYTNTDVMINTMTRTITEVDHSLSPFNVTKMTFTYQAYDCDATPEIQEIPENTVSPAFSVDIVNQI